jgi:hypothetical protein
MGYSISIPYTLPAATVIANILVGTALAYFGGPAKVTIYGSCDVAGDTHQLSRQSGHEAPVLDIPTSPIPAASTAGAVKTNENFIAQIAVPGGSSLVHQVNGTNTHVGRFLYVIE